MVEQIIKSTCASCYSCLQALANRLHDILEEEVEDKYAMVHNIKEETKKKELRSEDDEEDFLDEGMSYYL